MIPLPCDGEKYVGMACCSKVICRGCDYANIMQEMKERRSPRCPFCREPVASTKEEVYKRRMKRVEMNDPVAMRNLGIQKRAGGDYSTAFEYLRKAAVQGDAGAHYELSDMYRCGEGVEKDKGKEIYHIEEAVIGGHPDAREHLGWMEYWNHSFERMAKHLIIAATQGSDEAIKSLMNAYTDGLVDKEDLAAALRAHKAAVDATKSPQREEADAFYCSMGLM